MLPKCAERNIITNKQTNENEELRCTHTAQSLRCDESHARRLLCRQRAFDGRAQNIVLQTRAPGVHEMWFPMHIRRPFGERFFPSYILIIITQTVRRQSGTGHTMPQPICKRGACSLLRVLFSAKHRDACSCE